MRKSADGPWQDGSQPGKTPPEKVYKTQEERDQALEATYTLDGTALLLLQGEVDSGQSTLCMVAGNTVTLAEDFWKYRQYETAGDVDRALLMWECQRFGRRLEPAAHGAMRFEIMRRMEGARPRPKPMFVDAADEKRWIKAAKNVGNIGDAHKRLEAICYAATGKRVVWKQMEKQHGMPREHFLVEFSPAQDRRLQLLWEQRVELGVTDEGMAEAKRRQGDATWKDA